MICAIYNCYIPGINDAHVEILENVLYGKILNVTMKVIRFLHITVHLPDVLCFNDKHSVWTSQKRH